MEHQHITPMTTAGCFAAIMVVLAFLSTYVPFFSMIGFFIMPIPMAVMYMKFGFRQALLTGIAAGILMGITISPVEAIIQILTFGAVGMAIGAGFRYEWPPAKMLFGVTAAFIVTCSVLMGAAYLFMGIDVFTMIQDLFSDATAQMIAQYEASGVSEVQIVEYKQQFKQVQQILPALLPLLFCLATMIVGYANIKVAQVILRRLGFSVQPFLPIRCWEIPRSMIYLYILAIVMNYWGTSRDIEWLYIIGLNLYQMAFFFICIEGIALLFYLINRRFHMRNGLQALFLISFFIMPVFSYAAFLAGLFDMLANYRKKRA
jgi:uncharacterized protein YybS (DUF2232 family)